MKQGDLASVRNAKSELDTSLEQIPDRICRPKIMESSVGAICTTSPLDMLIDSETEPGIVGNGYGVGEQVCSRGKTTQSATPKRDAISGIAVSGRMPGCSTARSLVYKSPR